MGVSVADVSGIPVVYFGRFLCATAPILVVGCTWSSRITGMLGFYKRASLSSMKEYSYFWSASCENSGCMYIVVGDFVRGDIIVEIEFNLIGPQVGSRQGVS